MKLPEKRLSAYCSILKRHLCLCFLFCFKKVCLLIFICLGLVSFGNNWLAEFFNPGFFYSLAQDKRNSILSYRNRHERIICQIKVPLGLNDPFLNGGVEWILPHVQKSSVPFSRCMNSFTSSSLRRQTARHTQFTGLTLASTREKIKVIIENYCFYVKGDWF